MKLVNKRKVESLDVYIALEKFGISEDKLDNTIHLFDKKQMKKASFILAPSIILFMLFFITGLNNAILIILAASYLGVVNIIRMLTSGIRLDKTIQKMDDYYSDGLSGDLEEYKEYYTEEYKEFIELEESKTDDEKKYAETLKKQQTEDVDAYEILNHEESVSQVSHEVDVYYNTYKLPKSVLTNAEWDSLFDSIFNLFYEKEIKNVYYQCLSNFIKRVLAKVLVKGNTTLSLGDFSSNLNILQTLVETCTPVFLTDEELDELKRKIESNITVHKVVASRRKKIVNIDEYKKN